MKHRTPYLAIAIASLLSLPAAAQEGAKVLFTSGALTVIDANGTQRVARQGDTLAAGDRLVTPPGGLAQIKLPDGALLSARPDSEVRLDRMGSAADKTVVQLNQGNVRVLNVDTPAGVNAKPVDIVTPVSTLQLGRGDGESIHVRSGGNPAQSGTFNRVQAGTAVISTPNGNLSLQPLQSGRVPNAGAAPVAIAELPRAIAQTASLAASPRTTGARPDGSPFNPGTSQLLTPLGKVAATDTAVARISGGNPNSSIRPAVAKVPVVLGGGIATAVSTGAGSAGRSGGGAAAPTVAVRPIVMPPPPPPPPPPKTRVQRLGR